MWARRSQTGELPVPGSPITLQLTDDRLVSVPLRTIDQDGAFVLSLQHPSALGVDKFLTISWESGRRWVLADARVMAPRFRPHPEAGKLRLRPERPVGTPSGRRRRLRRRRAADAPTAAGATHGDRRPRETRRRPTAPLAVGGRPLGVLRPWQGEHPTVNVAMRLSSGRVRHDRRAPHRRGGGARARAAPPVVDRGRRGGRGRVVHAVRLADRPTQVMPSKTGADADAGLLRLGLADAPRQACEPARRQARQGQGRRPRLRREVARGDKGAEVSTETTRPQHRRLRVLRPTSRSASATSSRRGSSARRVRSARS